MEYRYLLHTILILLVPGFSQAAEHVILISIDGLRPDIINQLGEDALPGFYRLRNQGVWTDNARTDVDITLTLPNHASMITGRRVMGPDGHQQVYNGKPGPAVTLHNNTGKYNYIPGIFDIAHDNGLSTALYASKDKFVLFDQSYNTENGAQDLTGDDNGTDKIDRYHFAVTNRSADALITTFIKDMNVTPYHLSFVHITDPDSAGHGGNWTAPIYHEVVKQVDSYLLKIFALIDARDALRNNTVIILVADHGGTGHAHGDASNPLNYTIPFYVWGAGIAQAMDIYQLNQNIRQNPESGQPDYAASVQPVRNGDAANLALQLLGLPPVPGSSINANQDLRVSLED